MEALRHILLLACLWLAAIPRASAQEAGASDDATELAKKLANPISSLISLPMQSNIDFGAGPDGDGFHYRLNIQPVIPFSLNEDWNLISRTILPFVYQEARRRPRTVPTRRSLLLRVPDQWPRLGTAFRRHLPLAKMRACAAFFIPNP